MATALGCLPSAIDDEPVVNIFNLLKYWIEEPPTHVILALRYLGQRKKSAPNREHVMAQMQEAATMSGQQMVSGKAPEGFLDAVEWAERMKKDKLQKQVVN